MAAGLWPEIADVEGHPAFSSMKAANQVIRRLSDKILIV